MIQNDSIWFNSRSLETAGSTGHDRAWGCHTDPVKSIFSSVYWNMPLFCMYMYICIYIYTVLCTSRCLYIFVMCRPKECSCAIWRPGCCHAHHVLVTEKSRSYAKASRISGIQLHKYSRMWSMWVALSDKRTIMHYTIYITWHLAVDAAAVSEKVGMATVLQTHAAFSKKVDAFAANTAASATQIIHILVPLIARWLGTEKPLHKLDLLQSTPCFALWTWTKWRNVTSNARKIMLSRTLRTWY